MATTTITIRQGCSRPSVSMVFSNGSVDGQGQPLPLDLTTKVVTVRWRVPGTPALKTGSAVVTDAVNGKARYDWATDGSDTAAAGTGQFEAIATDPATGETWSWPIDAPAALAVVARVV